MGKKIVVVIEEITDENRKELLYAAIAAYVGERCRYCGHIYKSVEDIYIRKVVWAGIHQYACKSCFDTNNPQEML